MVGYLQPVNDTPIDMAVMYTVLRRSQFFARCIGLTSVDCVFDQACYAKALQVIWSLLREFADISCRLGVFHTVSVMIAALFKMFGDAGLVDVITESTIVACGSLNGVITGHHYYRAVRTLKIVYEAFSRLHFKSFHIFLEEKHELDIELDLIHDKIVALRTSFSADDTQVFLNSDSFKKLHEYLVEFRSADHGPMFHFWTSFLQMVELLLNFIHASREGDWHLHLSCIREMLPWFLAYDQVNCSRYGAYYFCSMQPCKFCKIATHRSMRHM